MGSREDKERRLAWIAKLEKLAEDQAGQPEGEAARRKADELRASVEEGEEPELEAADEEPRVRQRRPPGRTRVRGPQAWFYSFPRWRRMLARAREEGRTLAVRWRSPYPNPEGSVSKWKAVYAVHRITEGVLLELRDYGSSLNRRPQRISLLDPPHRFVPEAAFLPLDDPHRMVRNPSRDARLRRAERAWKESGQAAGREYLAYRRELARTGKVQFPHDCDDCVFLEWLWIKSDRTGPRGRIYEFYYHPPGTPHAGNHWSGSEGLLVWRTGPGQDEQNWMLIHGHTVRRWFDQVDPALQQEGAWWDVLDRARERGLIPSVRNNPNGCHGDPPGWTGPPSRPHWIPLDEWIEAVENMTPRELHDFIRRSWWRWVYVGRYETPDPEQGRLFREPEAGDNGDEDD